MYLGALRQYADREQHARVPASHVEHWGTTSVALGAWVGYVRQRRRKDALAQSRIDTLNTVAGWEWGPLRPGPVPDQARDAEIRHLRAQGVSLQQIGDRFGLSRQRIHQIVHARGLS